MIVDYIEMLSRKHTASKDSLILDAIERRDGTALIFLSQAKHRGLITQFPDGREIFVWDGKPLIEFYPITTSFDGTKMKVEQKYRLYT